MGVLKNIRMRILSTGVALLAVLLGARASGGAELTVPTYASRTLPFVEGAEPFRVALGDLNGDGRIDVAVCGSTLKQGWVRLYLARADGDYDIRDLEAPTTPRGIAIADLDGDGHPDLVTANNLARSVSIYPGDGTGGFGQRKDLPYLANPFAVVVDDLDGDDRPDLVVAGESGSVGVFRNQGNLEFRQEGPFDERYGPSDVITIDLDGDGRRDIVATNWREGYLSLYSNRGARVYPMPTVPYGGKDAFGVAGGDFNGDGHADLAVTLLDASKIVVLFGQGRGKFAAGPLLPVGSGVRDVERANLNGDAALDLVSVSTDAGEVGLFYGDGHGGFASVAALKAGTHPRSAAVGDLNGDGLDDIVVANLASHDVTVFTSRAAERIAARPVPPDPSVALRPLTALAAVSAQAEKDFKAGDTEGALGALERIIAVGEPLFRTGALVPDAGRPEWRQYLSAVVLASEIRRDRLHDPAGARAIERRLARLAERRRYFNLAGVEWTAVAEIELADLKDPVAASWSYERVLRLAKARALAAPNGSVYPPIEAGALYALDRLHAREPEYRRRFVAVELPTSFRPEKSDLGGMVLPHAAAYSTPRDVKPGESFREFSATHPHGFRGAYADYIDYMTAIALGGVIGEAADAVALRDGFMARHPDDPLGLEVVSVTLRAVRGEYYEREVMYARQVGERLGVKVEVSERSGGRATAS